MYSPNDPPWSRYENDDKADNGDASCNVLPTVFEIVLDLIVQASAVQISACLFKYRGRDVISLTRLRPRVKMMMMIMETRKQIFP